MDTPTVQPASPLPWSIRSGPFCEVEDAAGLLVADCIAYGEGPAATANTLYIVTACNAFPALVEALLKLSNEAHGFLSMADTDTHGYTNIAVLRQRIEEAHAALSVAEGRE